MKRDAYKITTIFFLAVFIVNVFGIRAFAGKAELEAISKAEKETQQLSAAKISAGAAIERPAVNYSSENLKDPFQGPGRGQQRISGQPQAQAASVNPPPLKVQGLIWGGNFPQAIINDTVVKVGDVIAGASINSIEKDGVIIYYQGREFNLSAPAAAPVSAKP